MPILKQLSPQARHAEKRLVQWGRWRQQQLSSQLDFSHKNILYDLMQTGGVRIKVTANTERNNQETEQVDALLNWLNRHKPKLAKVLKYHYTQSGTLRAKAAKLRLPKSTYYDVLREGQRWLGYQLLYVKPTPNEITRVMTQRCA